MIRAGPTADIWSTARGPGRAGHRSLCGMGFLDWRGFNRLDDLDRRVARRTPILIGISLVLFLAISAAEVARGRWAAALVGVGLVTSAVINVIRRRRRAEGKADGDRLG